MFQWKGYEFKSCLCCYLTAYLWAKHLPSLILSFVIYYKGIMHLSCGLFLGFSEIRHV